MRYRLATQAERDMLEIFDYIGRDSLERARRMIERFYREFEQIAEHPTLFPIQHHLRPDLRTVPVGKYRVLFRIRHDGVMIERVVHGARDLPRIVRTMQS